MHIDICAFLQICTDSTRWTCASSNDCAYMLSDEGTPPFVLQLVNGRFHVATSYGAISLPKTGERDIGGGSPVTSGGTSSPPRRFDGYQLIYCNSNAKIAYYCDIDPGQSLICANNNVRGRITSDAQSIVFSNGATHQALYTGGMADAIDLQKGKGQIRLIGALERGNVYRVQCIEAVRID